MEREIQSSILTGSNILPLKFCCFQVVKPILVLCVCEKLIKIEQPIDYVPCVNKEPNEKKMLFPKSPNSVLRFLHVSLGLSFVIINITVAPNGIVAKIGSQTSNLKRFQVNSNLQYVCEIILTVLYN